MAVLKELALFAGAGGGLLASRILGWRTVCAVENNPYRQAVLLARQADGCLDTFPIWDDVRTFDGTAWRGKVDIVTGGFPCQPFSHFGAREAEQSDKDLWPETIRVIREVGPRLCLLENVSALLIYGYFGEILAALAESGLGVRWACIPAATVGAPHQRERVWLVAHANNNGEPERNAQESGGQSIPCWDYACGLDAARARATEAKSAFRGMDDVVAARVDRLAALGDGQVPLCAAVAFRLLAGDDACGAGQDM